MKVHITNLYGQSDRSVAQIAQNMTAEIARQLGYRELGIYNYPVEADSASELQTRIDGIISSLGYGDVVIFQVPTWNDMAFDEKFINTIRAYLGVKVVIYVHDVLPLMFASNRYLMSRVIAMYNLADVIILPSENMLDVLREEGLTVEKTIIQGMWDHPTTVPIEAAAFKKEILFPGNPERFEFIKNWQSSVPLRMFTGSQTQIDGNVINEGWYYEDALVNEMSKGGFGLIWYNEDVDYNKLYCPYKLGAYMAAGIPVFIQRGMSNQELIESNNLGFIVDSLDDVTKKIEAMTAEDYQIMVKDVRHFANLIRNGFFTRKLLTDAVYQALIK